MAPISWNESEERVDRVLALRRFQILQAEATEDELILTVEAAEAGPVRFPRRGCEHERWVVLEFHYWAPDLRRHRWQWFNSDC